MWYRAPSRDPQPKITPRNRVIILIIQRRPYGRRGCVWHCLRSRNMLQATANLRQHCEGVCDRDLRDVTCLLAMQGWLARAGKGRRWQRQRMKQYFNKERKQRNPEREIHHTEEDSCASSPNGSWEQEGLRMAPAQGLWRKMAHQQHNGRRRRRRRKTRRHHCCCAKPPHQDSSGGQSSPRLSPQHSLTIRNEQPQASPPAHDCSYSLGLQQHCESATGSNGRDGDSESRNGHSSPLWNNRWDKRFCVPLKPQQEMITYLRPMNVGGHCPPGMRAPHNTTQYIMEQHEDEWENKEEAVAMYGGNGINSVMDEDLFLRDPLQLTAPEDRNIFTDAEEEEEFEVEENKKEDKDREQEESMQLACQD